MGDGRQSIKRRRYLTFLGVSATIGVAGCVSDGDDGEEGEEPDGAGGDDGEEGEDPDETGGDDVEEGNGFEGMCDRQTAQALIDEWQAAFWEGEVESVEQMQDLIHSDWFSDEQVEELFDSVVETDESPLGSAVTVEYGNVESVSTDFEKLINFIEQEDIVAETYFEQLQELGYIREEDEDVELNNLFLALIGETTTVTGDVRREGTLLVLLAPEDGDCKIIGDLIYLDIV